MTTAAQIAARQLQPWELRALHENYLAEIGPLCGIKARILIMCMPVQFVRYNDADGKCQFFSPPDPRYPPHIQAQLDQVDVLIAEVRRRYEKKATTT